MSQKKKYFKQYQVFAQIFYVKGLQRYQVFTQMFYVKIIQRYQVLMLTHTQ